MTVGDIYRFRQFNVVVLLNFTLGNFSISVQNKFSVMQSINWAFFISGC